ncbi:alpha/beta fold hydrolase [Paraburkholderia silvatlantica]|uniref:alpha/beta fold hydrolase n=1 Tax=Paraburkholderia silvatlantica TaxID=321895 RepID=UPI0010D7F4F3|nr:alpha/beta hydrolase [Paraburkholderia silvatlantica]TDQ97522.1 microsomal epoxide hydrolase [Paraburkholderia silvatlantica]
MNTPSRMIDHGPASLPDPILPGFEHRFATIEGTRLHYVIGGNKDGETVVLLAGYPESWFAWRKVMPLLAERYRVIVPDLPGQGDSDRPQGGYDTQSLATSLHALLEKLEAHRYHLAAHDVGAWVAYPYAALFGDEVSKLALLDAGIPGITLPEALPVAPERAWRTWHFAFHAIPDLPELLIAGKERAYLEWFLRRKTANPQTFTDADIDEYLRVFTREGGLRAGLAYYRAADVSARQNRELSTRGKLRMPVLALSADLGSIADMAGPLRDYADEVRGATIAWCGHFLPEEQPAAVAEELLRFFGQP